MAACSACVTNVVSVHVASARTDRFVSDAWARRQGQEGAKRWTVSAEEQATGLGCSTGLCRWRKGPWRIALVSDERRLSEACGSADVVLATVDAKARCRGPRVVIDRRDAWKEGAQALWLNDLDVRRETTNAARGDRPWVPNSPSRRAMPVRAPGAGVSPVGREGMVALHFPQHVHDHPAFVEFGQMQVIDPGRGHDLGAGGILEDVEHSDVLYLLRLGRRSVGLVPGELSQGERAHLGEMRAPCTPDRDG